MNILTQKHEKRQVFSLQINEQKPRYVIEWAGDTIALTYINITDTIRKDELLFGVCCG